MNQLNISIPARVGAHTPEIELRPYQRRIVDQAYQGIRDKKLRQLLVIIMGAGKTVIAGSMIRDAVSRGHRCLFLVALNVLLEQTQKELQSLGVDCTILQGDRKVDPSAPVVVASCQTIAARVRKHGPQVLDSLLLGPLKLIVVDEAHNTAWLQAYDAIDQHYAESIVVGLTATPWRLSRKQWLGQKFNHLITGPQPPDIVAMGAAVPCRGFTITGALDLDNLHTRNGDYIDAEMASQACRPEALAHVVSEWKRLCLGRPTLMVGSTVEQATLTQQAFIADGIPAALIVGATPQAERQAIFEAVKAGEVTVICSVGCLTAGFNLPIISAVLYVRATKSKALFHQTAGRGSRPWPGKTDYILLDFGGNLKRHKDPMGYQAYDISEPPELDDQLMTKTCPECKAEISIFAQVCPECGHEFPQDDCLQDEDDPVLVALNEFVDRFTKSKIKNLRQWRKQACLDDLAPDSAIERFSSTYGHIPPREWLLHAALGKRASNKRKGEFFAYLQRHCAGGRWAEPWLNHHLLLEFGTADIDQIGLFRHWDEVLGVHYSASWETVKQAYMERIRLLPDDHPDHESLALALADAKADLTQDLNQGEVA